MCLERGAAALVIGNDPQTGFLFGRDGRKLIRLSGHGAAVYRLALKLRATRPPAHPPLSDRSWPLGHNTPFPLERSPPVSFKRLLDGVPSLMEGRAERRTGRRKLASLGIRPARPGRRPPGGHG